MRKYQPALIGGVFIGVLSSLPIVNYLNYCCCLWVVCGGVLVMYLQQQASPTPVATGDAAISGLIAGALGALLFCIVLSVFIQAAAPMILEQVRDQSAQMPPEALAFVERLFSSGGLTFFGVTSLIFVPTFAVFAMLGSFLGLAIFRKKTPPQPQV
jgi:hypothetical protein